MIQCKICSWNFACVCLRRRNHSNFYFTCFCFVFEMEHDSLFNAMRDRENISTANVIFNDNLCKFFLIARSQWTIELCLGKIATRQWLEIFENDTLMLIGAWLTNIKSHISIWFYRFADFFRRYFFTAFFWEILNGFHQNRLTFILNSH